MKMQALLYVLLAACLCHANEVVLIPPDLGPGDQYRLIFTTSSRHDAISTDIEVYNDFVQSVADSAPVVGSWDLEWRAIAGTDTVAARDNASINHEVDVSVPVYRVDGEPFVPRYLDFWQGAGGDIPLSALDVSELGTQIEGFEFESDTTGVPVFTGLATGGGIDDRLFLGAPSAAIGLGSIRFGGMFFYSALKDFDEAHFYAISEVLTVPEPSGAALSLLVALVGAMLRRR